MKEEIILKLVQIQNQFRFLHWQTFGDAKHRAYGELYDTVGKTNDSWRRKGCGVLGTGLGYKHLYDAMGYRFGLG